MHSIVVSRKAKLPTNVTFPFKLQLGPNFCKQLRRVITFVRTQWSALAAFAAVSFSRSSRGLKCTEDTAAAAEVGAEDAEAAAATGGPSIAEEEASKQTRHCLTRLQSHSRRERHIKGGTGRKVAHFTLLRGKKTFQEASAETTQDCGVRGEVSFFGVSTFLSFFFQVSPHSHLSTSSSSVASSALTALERRRRNRKRKGEEEERSGY